MRALHLTTGLLFVLLARAQEQPQDSAKESTTAITTSGRVTSVESGANLLRFRAFEGDKEITVSVPKAVKFDFRDTQVSKLSDLTEGMPVKVIYRIQDGKNVASAVSEATVPTPASKSAKQEEKQVERQPAAAQPANPAANPVGANTVAPGTAVGGVPGAVATPGANVIVGRFGAGGGLQGVADQRGAISGRIVDIRGDVVVVLIQPFRLLDKPNNPANPPNVPGTAPGEINAPKAQNPPVAEPPKLSPTPQVPGALPPTQAPQPGNPQQPRANPAQPGGAVQQPPAAAAPQDGFRSAQGDFVVLTTAETNSSTLLHLTQQTRVQIDGRAATLADLREGFQVALTVAAQGNLHVVTQINATSGANPVPKNPAPQPQRNQPPPAKPAS